VTDAIPLPPLVDVSVLSWPEEDRLRQQLAWFNLPRLLLVGAADHPPQLLDELEDWIRTPADPVDLHARCDVLLERATATTTCHPLVDEDGLLWMGSTWVALTSAQVPVVRLLLDNLTKVVRFDAVMGAYEGAGASGHPASVRTMLARLGARVRQVGLELHTVRRRGILLTVASDPPSRQR
jgi:phosphoglycolate phosphatase-like HAD superfamily hydrolase